jgi:predicted  nucleic acid-binding Zn-ribbon protein
MRKFVYKFEITEEEWLRIHGKLDEAIRLLHELANDDYTVTEAISADEALSDLESSINGYEIKEESEMGSEEKIALEMDMSDYDYIINSLKIMQRNIVGRANIEPYMMANIDMCLNILEKYNVEEPKVGEKTITLEMDMSDYGYVINVFKGIQSNIVGRVNVEPYMLMLPKMCLNILERSIIEEPEEGIEMSEEEWNKIRNGAISGRYEWTDNMPTYGPDPWKEINILKETIKTQADMIGDVRGRILPLTDMYNDHEDRIAELYEEVNNLKDFVTKLDIDNLKDQFKSYDNADKALHRRLQFVEHRLESINLTAPDLKFDNRIHDYAERLTAVEDGLNKLWDIVTGSDDSLDERVETLDHKMDALIERDNCFFDKLKEVKNNMKELAQSEADKHNRLAMTVQNLKDFVEGKYDKDKLDISSASFNIYFENSNKKEDDDE